MRRILAGMFVLGALLVACGDDDDAGTSSDAPANPEAEAVDAIVEDLDAATEAYGDGVNAAIEEDDVDEFREVTQDFLDALTQVEESLADLEAEGDTGEAVEELLEALDEQTDVLEREAEVDSLDEISTLVEFLSLLYTTDAATNKLLLAVGLEPLGTEVIDLDPAEGEVVLEEDFEPSDFDSFENDFFTVDPQDDGLLLTVSEPDRAGYAEASPASGDFPDDIAELGDVSVEADVSKRAPQPGSMGLNCRMSPDFSEYYAALFDLNGNWWIYRFSGSDGGPSDFETLASFEDDGEEAFERIAPGDSVNHLRLDCVDDGDEAVLTFYINGEEVAQATDSDPLAAGAIAMTVGTNADTDVFSALFDNLLVTAVD